MAKIFFTADWHLGSKNVLDSCKRPFDTVERMNAVLITNCNQIAPEKTDFVIHAGDFACYKKDRNEMGLNINPNLFHKIIHATFVPLEGNHDPNNKVKFVGSSLRLEVGPFEDVSIGHYPSYDKRAIGSFQKGDIHLCGHVHDKWKYFIDKENEVLNVNVGVDVWEFKPISEDELANFIQKIMKNF
jgi:calcineurin-like phosphoesterase family protein